MGVGGDVAGVIGSVPFCQACRTERVVRDAWACWNSAAGLWELEAVFDHEFCLKCDSETSFSWKRLDVRPSGAIRDLNDDLRMRGSGNGTWLVTAGMQSRGDAFLQAAVAAIQSFADFSEANDPWGEHDFGSVTVDGSSVFWKIDYYDLELKAGSPNPANPGVTRRVLTVMLPDEY